MKTQPVTFAAMTDLHLDIMHDGMMRIDAFLDAAQRPMSILSFSWVIFLIPRTLRPVYVHRRKCPSISNMQWNVRLKYQN